MHFENPCSSCGACCASYRVSFYWGEADRTQGGMVPLELIEELSGFRRSMKGTNQEPSRCIALQGQVGGKVNCTIYACRPSPCREFGVTWRKEELRAGPGELERCNQARAAWRLPPLSRAVTGEFDPGTRFQIRS